MRSPSIQLAGQGVILGGFVVLMLAACSPSAAGAGGGGATLEAPFPPSLDSYGDDHLTSLWAILENRVEREPFNLWATLIFLAAIIHTFLTHRFQQIAHVLEDRQRERLRLIEDPHDAATPRFSTGARIFHFLGEVEAVFGIWVIPLFIVMWLSVSEGAALGYLNERVNFTEAVFVVVIMAISSTRPILELAERLLRLLARLGGERPVAWWLVLVTIGPLLGSFITEPAAMTICASLLSRKFYSLEPGKKLAYGTLGLLFVSISVGGTLTHFAAPPVLMVVAAWDWDTPFMLAHFGWKAAIGIFIAATGYLLFFYKDLRRLGGGAPVTDSGPVAPPIPLWVTLVHVAFLLFAVLNAHHPIHLIMGCLFFLAVVEVTEDYQRDFTLRPPVLVGFFLAGLVIHGGLQQWWIAPVLGRLDEIPLLIGAAGLTAFNDNAAITYLATLVPTLTEGMKYAVVAGAVTGGGLTVIANAPNPAGQSILKKHFEDGIGAGGLLLGALVPTIILGLCFILLR